MLFLDLLKPDGVPIRFGCFYSAIFSVKRLSIVVLPARNPVCSSGCSPVMANSIRFSIIFQYTLSILGMAAKLLSFSGSSFGPQLSIDNTGVFIRLGFPPYLDNFRII